MVIEQSSLPPTWPRRATSTYDSESSPLVQPALPTWSDISIHDSLDERCAVEHFYGKGLKQAEELFREDFLYYQEDLMWMGPRAFCYYVNAAIGYLLDGESATEELEIACFCSIVEFQLDSHGEEIAPVHGQLSTVIQEIIKRLVRKASDTAANQVDRSDLIHRCETLLPQLGA